MTTMKDIAKKAGISVGTVHRVIHKSGYVSKKAEEKVKKVIDELGYKPNIFARNLKRTKNYRFGVLIPNESQDDFFWKLHTEGIQQAEKELFSQKLSIEYFNFDRYSYISYSLACEKALNAKLDGLVITPVLTSVSIEFLEKIPNNLPYILIDTNIPNQKSLSHILQDSYLSGRVAAQLMDIKVSKNGTLAVLQFSPTSMQIDERIRGFTDYIAEKRPAINIFNINVKSQAKRKEIEDNLAESLLSIKSKLSGVFVSNTLTFYAAKTVKENFKKNKIPVIGYNLIAKNIDYMKEGYIDFLINEKPEVQGYKAIYELYKSVVLGEEIQKSFMMPIDIITSEKIEYYLENYLK